jgi:hypothetical protein
VSVAQNVFRDITSGVETEAAQIGLHALECHYSDDVTTNAAFLELIDYCKLLFNISADHEALCATGMSLMPEQTIPKLA